MSGHVLKEIDQSDYKAISSLVANPGELLNVSGGPLGSALQPDEFDQYFVNGSGKDKNRLSFKWVDESSSKTFGMISYTRVDWENDCGHIGIVAIDPQFRSNGVGASMVKEAVNMGFNTLGLNRIDLVVVKDNIEAYKFYVDKIGFRSEGLARDIVKIGDDYVSCFVLSMLKEDWLMLNTD